VEDSEEVWVGIVSLALKAPAEVARTMLDPPAGGSIDIAAGEGSLRMLRYSWFGAAYEARLRTHGPDVSDDDAEAVADELCHLARGLAADIDYAAVDYDEPGVHEPRYLRTVDMSSSYPAYMIPEVCPWQILSPHLAFRVSSTIPPGELLPGGRREVAFGTFGEWREPAPSWAQHRSNALVALTPLIHDGSPLIVVPRSAESGTHDEIAAQVEGHIRGGTWVAPSLYRLLTEDHALDVEITPIAVNFRPAGPRAVPLARTAAAAFPGRPVEYDLPES
jgi:hypothetical protein